MKFQLNCHWVLSMCLWGCVGVVVGFLSHNQMVAGSNLTLAIAALDKLFAPHFLCTYSMILCFVNDMMCISNHVIVIIIPVMYLFRAYTIYFKLITVWFCNIECLWGFSFSLFAFRLISQCILVSCLLSWWSFSSLACTVWRPALFLDSGPHLLVFLAF